MKFLVLGRGFAAYGYTPALVNLGHEVYVSKELYRRLRSYQFLNPKDCFRVKKFDWSHHSFDAIVLALRPFEVEKYFLRLEKFITNKTHIYLEKPVSENPLQGLKLLKKLEKIGAKYTVNYSFLWTVWYQKIQYQIERADHVICKWEFVAGFDVDREKWKSIHSQGGGALLFYAVHFLSLVPLSRNIEVLDASLTTTNVGDSKVTCLLRTLKTNTGQQAQFDIHLDFNSEKNNFLIIADGKIAHNSEDPFSEPKHELDPTQNSRLDRRFSNLKAYISSSQCIKEYEFMKRKALYTQDLLIQVVAKLKNSRQIL